MTTRYHTITAALALLTTPALADDYRSKRGDIVATNSRPCGAAVQKKLTDFAHKWTLDYSSVAHYLTVRELTKPARSLTVGIREWAFWDPNSSTTIVVMVSRINPAQPPVEIEISLIYRTGSVCYEKWRGVGARIDDSTPEVP